QCQPDGAADPYLGSLHAAQWRWWRRRALERTDLALPPKRLPAEDASDPALWREIPARRHDDPGLGRHLRRARAPLRQIRVSVRHIGQGGQRQRPEATRWQSVRRPSVSTAPDAAAEAAQTSHT